MGFEVKTPVVEDLLIVFRLCSWIVRYNDVFKRDKVSQNSLSKLRRDYEKLISNAKGAAKEKLVSVAAFQSLKELGMKLETWIAEAAKVRVLVEYF